MQTTGGRNGYGAKLANIYSSMFVIETSDGRKNNRSFSQVRTAAALHAARARTVKHCPIARRMACLTQQVLVTRSWRVRRCSGTTWARLTGRKSRSWG